MEAPLFFFNCFQDNDIFKEGRDHVFVTPLPIFRYPTPYISLGEMRVFITRSLLTLTRSLLTLGVEMRVFITLDRAPKEERIY